MDKVVSLPDPLYKRLAFRSQQLKRTPDEIVVDLVQQYLDEPDDRWQIEFQALLSQVRSRSLAFPSDEIEADITAASAEVRKFRRDHRTP